MNDNQADVTPASLKLHERVAALEAVQARHDDDITKLSTKIDGLSNDLRSGIGMLSKKISEINTARSRLITGAITGGAAIGGGAAVGLYQLLHTLVPRLFGG